MIGPQWSLSLAFAWTSLVNYGFSLSASRLLTPGDFGLLAFAQAILLLGATILQSGIPWSLTKSIIRSPDSRGGSLVRGALIANLGLAAGLGLSVVVLYLAGPLRVGLEQGPVALLVIATLLLFAIASIARATVQALSAFRAMAALQAIEVTVKAAGGLLLIGAGMGAIGAVAGFALGAVAAAIFGVIVTGRLGIGLLGPREMPDVRIVGPMFGTLLGLALVFNLDLFAVKLLVEDRAVSGYYQAAIILASAPYFFVNSVVVPVLFTRLANHKTLQGTQENMAHALRVAIVFLLPVELLLVAYPAEVLGAFFPATYSAAAPILRLMAVGNGALMVLAIVATGFQAIGRTGIPARIILSVVVIEAMILALVVPRGGAGAAVGSFVLAATTCAVILAGLYLREAHVQVGPLGAWLIRFGAASAIGIGSAMGIGSALGPRMTGGAVIGLVIGAAAYYLMAVALRVIGRPRFALAAPPEA